MKLRYLVATLASPCAANLISRPFVPDWLAVIGAGIIGLLVAFLGMVDAAISVEDPGDNPEPDKWSDEKPGPAQIHAFESYARKVVQRADGKSSTRHSD